MERRVKARVLLVLDLAVAHQEIRPQREPFIREFISDFVKQHGASDFLDGLLPSNSVDMFRDWFGYLEEDGPISMTIDARYVALMAQVDDRAIETALVAWQNRRGADARKRRHNGERVPPKMQPVADLLARLGIRCTAASLSVLWSQLGTPKWREDEWFRGWGAKKVASAKH